MRPIGLDYIQVRIGLSTAGDIDVGVDELTS